jgi:hypothetical protein
MNPASNNSRFWTFNETDAATRGNELKKYASSTASRDLDRISATLKAVMPDLSEPSSPVSTPDAGDALEKARRAGWYFTNQAAGTVDYSTVKLADPVMAQANFEQLILEQENQILGNHVHLSPKNTDFNTADELKNVLSKNLAHGGNEPNPQTLHEGMTFYESATPADPAAPAKDVQMARLRHVIELFTNQGADEDQIHEVVANVIGMLADKCKEQVA